MSQPPNTMSFRDASGTKSLICGDLASVRLPSRIVPICVSDPMGLARPRRIAITPAIVVVLTAPRPTSMTPSLPSGVSIFLGFVTTADYTIRIISKSRNRVIWNPMAFFRKSAPTDPLAVTMTGVKLGDRFLAIGLGDPRLTAALAAKAGLTGRACAVDADPVRLKAGAAEIG